MLTDRIEDKTITVQSTYDSSKHNGFIVSLQTDGSWRQESPNTFLTSEQIKIVETVILSLVKGLLSND